VTERSDAANAAPNAAAKKVRGKPFPKGRSANPAGKRPGTRHRKTLWIEAMSEGDREAIIAKVLKLARPAIGRRCGWLSTGSIRRAKAAPCGFR